MSTNRFLMMNQYLSGSQSKFVSKPSRRLSEAKFKKKKSGCKQVSEAEVDSDQFVLDMLEFFFDERLTADKLNDELRDIAARAAWKATEGSSAMDMVPRPTYGKPTFKWLVKQAVQIAIRKAQNQCIYEAVRKTVKLSMRSEYELAQIAEAQSRWVRPFTDTLTISDKGVDFIKQFEGFKSELYNDPVGHCTIGYGTLVHKGNCDGSEPEEFKKGVSEKRATELLKDKASQFESAITKNVKVAINQNQFDALVSFVYNIGEGAFKDSTLLKKLNKGEYEAVPTELKKWVKASGKTLPGLVRRREAEAKLFTDGSYALSKSLNGYGWQFSAPRGIRNNNPGNIEINKANNWEGRVPLEENTDKRFEQFKSYDYGVRALIVLLRNYIKNGRDTVQTIFAAYAPPEENNTQSYIKFVAGRLGVAPTDKLTVTKNILKELAQAIAKMENGVEAITDEQFEAGFNLLSDDVKKSIGQSYYGSYARNYGYGMEANNRALIVLLENQGVDLGLGEFADKIISMLPGSSMIPNSTRDALVKYLNEKIRQATDTLLENAELTINRYEKAKPSLYGEVIILRNSTATYQELTTNLIRLSEAGKVIDLFILTHGSNDYISLIGEGINAAKIRDIKAANGGKPIRLRSVYMMNCVGSSLNSAWLSIGAKTSSGSRKNNYIPEPTMYFFWRNWQDGQTFNKAVTNSYKQSIESIKAIIRGAGDAAIPFGGKLAEYIADIENRDFIIDSAPVLQGDDSVTITADALSFTQSIPSSMATTVVPLSALRGEVSFV